jgi:hypothetical protein
MKKRSDEIFRGDLPRSYAPINCLKPLAENIWIVDGPIVWFGPPALKMPFPTRMTIIRLGNSLFIHSPTQLVESLNRDVCLLGRPSWLIAPNRLHRRWLPNWKTAFEEAQVYLAPCQNNASLPFAFDTETLEPNGRYPWDHSIASVHVNGRFMTEVVFFHRASHTLILTDLIENFEPKRLSLLSQILARFGGCLDPNGGMPIDLRVTYPTNALRRAIEIMLAWEPERIVIAHGRCYLTNGEAELRRAFSSLLR